MAVWNCCCRVELTGSQFSCLLQQLTWYFEAGDTLSRNILNKQASILGLLPANDCNACILVGGRRKGATVTWQAAIPGLWDSWILLGHKLNAWFAQPLFKILIWLKCCHYRAFCFEPELRPPLCTFSWNVAWDRKPLSQQKSAVHSFKAHLLAISTVLPKNDNRPKFKWEGMWVGWSSECVNAALNEAGAIS